MHSAEKSRDTTLDDEKYDMCYSRWRPIGKNMMAHCTTMSWRHSVTSPKLSLRTSVMTSHVTCVAVCIYCVHTYSICKYVCTWKHW